MKIPNRTYAVPAESPYKPKYGDLLCEFASGKKVAQFLEPPPKKEEILEKQIMPLAILDPDPFKALEKLRIVCDDFKAIYECPYTKYVSYSVLPTAVISDDLKGKYDFVNHWNKDYLFDHEFHKRMHGERLLELEDIEKLLMGSGYTHMTGIHDGSRGKLTTTIKLDNGDKLFVYFWEWYNK